jgi:lycopene cyclase domain-containing protein
MLARWRTHRRPAARRHGAATAHQAVVFGLGYTAPVVVAVVAVCAWEIAYLHTGLFRRLGYWLSMLIVFGFQIPVDGWLTKLSAPIVRYTPGRFSGLRVPWDIPVEDFLFGFVLVTATLLLWERQSRSPDRKELPS